MVVYGEGGKLLGKGAHFGREAVRGCAVHVDEQVELAFLQAAERDEVGHALEEAGLAEGMDVRRGERIVSCGREHPREGNHRAKRIPVRAEMPRNENPLGFLQQLFYRRITGMVFHGDV